MDTKLKNNHKWNQIIPVMFIICFVAAALYMVKFPDFRSTAERNYENPLEQEMFTQDVYKSIYVLYSYLYEKVQNEPISFADLYMETEIVEERELHPDGEGITFRFTDISYTVYPYELFGYDSGEEWDASDDSLLTADGEQYGQWTEEDAEYVKQKVMEQLEYNFRGSFVYSASSRYFDYYMEDNKTGVYITNSSEDFQNPDNFEYLIQITYDEDGNLADVRVKSQNDAVLMKKVTRIGQSQGGFYGADFSEAERATGIHFKLNAPSNCTIYYGLTVEGMNSLKESELWGYYGNWWDMYDAYHVAGTDSWLCFFLVPVLLAAFFLPMRRKIWEYKAFRLPFEAAALILGFGFSIVIGKSQMTIQIMNYCEGITQEKIAALIGYGSIAGVLAYVWTLLLVFAFFAVMAYAVLNLREARDLGIRVYLRKRSYIRRFFPYARKKLKQAYKYFTQFDISKESNKAILRLLVVNGILVSFFTLFWFGGIIAVLIYSVILYFIMRKYLSDMRKKYEILLQATNQIAEGNLNVKITQNLGLFEPFKPQIEKIQEGFKNAVEEEVKSQRMKTELITNVSHDLKTPLTAIITYINLLKEEGVTEEERREYLDTLSANPCGLRC